MKIQPSFFPFFTWLTLFCNLFFFRICKEHASFVGNTFEFVNGILDKQASVEDLVVKEKGNFRNLGENSPDHVKQLYKGHHSKQTLEFVLAKKREYTPLNKKKMTIWEAVDLLVNKKI